MTRTMRITIAVTLLFAVSLIAVHPAHAQYIGISGAQAAGIAVAGVGALTGVGLLLYFTLRAPRSITGCVVSDSAGTAIQNELDHQVFLLTGDASTVRVGDRVKVKGKRSSKGPDGRYRFTVKNLKKDYGACALTGTPPSAAPQAQR